MESAHPRGGTSVRSWLESVRNRVTTLGNASCPIARQALRRSRILLWVSQLSKATIDQKWEEYYLQDGQLRTSCRSRVIGQFWEQFVLYNSITGLVGRRCTLSLWKQGCINLIFRFSIRAKWRTSHQVTGAVILKNPKPKKKRGMTRRIRTIRWQIFLFGWRSSKAILWKNCLLLHTVLRK